jgi:hypothetical protein
MADMITATRSICRITVTHDNKSGRKVVIGDCKDLDTIALKLLL